MKIVDLLTVIDSNAYLNIITEKGHWIYEGKVIFYNIWFVWKKSYISRYW